MGILSIGSVSSEVRDYPLISKILRYLAFTFSAMFLHYTLQQHESLLLSAAVYALGAGRNNLEAELQR